ncbi:MAG: prephenate dehydrogenase/arogenate dehydrogenase family protein [Fimbriimonadales bacterium]|nr:prephenate dehydrogenase/arogenate dehydrogenase family protein [Fimbriimonadales bacterium]
MTLSILGLGGIGASVGLAYQHAELSDAVWGYDIDPDALQGALEIGAIDRPAESIEACADADVVLIAAPPYAVPEIMAQLAPRLRPETVLTDVVSVKLPVLAWASQYLPYPNRFVGGHPIAGTERRGYPAARADLFQGATWVLTPTPDTDADAIVRVEQLVRAVRAIPVRMDAAPHDREFALLSFIPHCLAFSLAALQAQNPTQLQGGGSWQSATRVAQSDPDLWTQLLLLNREPTTEWLRVLIERLQAIQHALQQGDAQRLGALLQRQKPADAPLRSE